jgi:phenylpropionate dioxygenase-like ring-hydroxylating dioxygenase large terminal subunit
MTAADDTHVLLDGLAARAGEDDNWYTLPPQVYCSQDIFDLEVERVFRRGWMNVGHVSQIPDAGDFRTVDMFGELLVVTRGRDGEISVLSRVCPHRWMDICSGRPAGNAPSLQCPYHRWTFSHDGQLRAAPEMAETPGFDKEAHGLHRFRHEVWEGFIYVNLDGDSTSTSDLWGPMSEQLREYGIAEWAIVDSKRWGESAWDWKVFIDNGECYHHLGIHDDTLEPFFPARLAVDLPDNGEYTLVYANPDAAILVQAVDGGLDFPSDDPAGSGLTSQQRTGLGLAYPFPNYVIAVMPQYAVWFEVYPLGPGHIDLTTHLMLPPHLADAPGADQRIAQHNASVVAVHEQDVEVCAGVQRGLEAASARPGMLCHLEQHNRSFARWYARRISTP